jgi:serine protease Do
MADALGLPHGKGQYAAAVVPNDPADKAGLQRGDIVTAISGQQVTEDQSAASIMAQTKPGSRVTLNVIRQGKPLTLTATVGSRPTSEELSKKDYGPFPQSGDNDNDGAGDNGTFFEQSLGLHVMALNPRIAQQLSVSPTTTGVVITDIEDGSDAADTPLNRGMIITSVNYRDIASTSEFHAAVSAAEKAGRNAVLLHVQAPNGQSGDVAVRFDSGRPAPQ